MDYESIQKAEVSKGQLMVSGESFKVLIIPSMQTIRFSIMEKALEFSKNGGIVVCVGDLPKASERAGREDNVLDAIIKEIFYNNGTGYIVSSIEQIKSIIDKSFVRDIILSEDSESFPYFLHRKTADLDIYLVYGAPKNSQCFFRAKGNVQLWNPWNANINKLIDIQETENGTRVKMPLGKDEVQLIVFNKHESNESKFKQLDVISEIPINDEWEFSLKPTLDNTWGDFRLPANNGFIGAEMRQPEYRCENKEWSKITLGYGPKFMKLGPLSDEEDLNYIEKCLVNSNIDGLNKYDIKPYEYGERFGVEGDPGHQGYHGLKGKITDEFIVLGKPAENQTEITYGAYEEGTIYYMWTTVFSDSNEKASILTGTIKPQKVWINGAECTGETSQLKIGSNAVVLKYNIAGRTYFDLGDVVSSAEVYVNGRFVDEKCAPSWQFNITDFVHEGENNLEVYAYNTLSNNYTTIPTKYRGSLKSGLIGPVTLQICK